MRPLQFVIVSILIFYSLCIPAQTKLSSSPRQSSEIHIYKIDKKDLRQIHLKKDSFDEEMLKTLVVKYKVGEKMPTLLRGNYVKVQVIENQLNITELVVDDLYAKIVPAKEFIVCLYDSLGNIIDDAEIKRGSSKLKFDKSMQVYCIHKVKDEELIEIAHHGVYHYLEIENYQYDYPTNNIFQSTWRRTKSLWYKTKYGVKYIFHPSERPTKQKYTGFIIFNKPKYKPGETVKLKAYLSEKNGNRYDKAIGIRLHGYFSSAIDTILTRLEPYQAGLYSYEFKLSESLDLQLDRFYNVSLVTDDKNANTISNSLQYEDYELKSINFSLTSDKNEFTSGDSIQLKMKVTDENEMAVYDGKVELVVVSQTFEQKNLKKGVPVFIADTLWQHTVDLSNASEKEFILPDSIFSSDTPLKFKVEATYLSSDNEKHTQNLYLSKLSNKYLLDFALDKGMLTIKELHEGDSHPTMAHIEVEGAEDEILYAYSIMLPHTLAVPWLSQYINVKTKNATDYFDTEGNNDEQIGYKFYRKNDSVYLQVENPAKIPFWYTIRNTKKEVAKGYVTQLNHATKDIGQEGYAMQINYLFGGESKSIQSSLPFVQKNLTIDVNTPTTVYPGQKTNVLVSVADKDGKPVRDADITAYSFTSKFKNYSMPNISIGGKAKYAKQFFTTRYNMDDDLQYNKKTSMTWNKWAETMALDTIEYYKFLYPDTYYVNKTSTTDGSTQISPFVVINGEVQGVHMMWIDEKLYYVAQSQQLDIYTFEIPEGKHSLRFRTHNREILALNFYLEEGKKHIMSFDAGKPYTRIAYEDPTLTPFVLTSRLLNEKERGHLSDKEELELRSKLITVNNTFGEIKLPNIKQVVELPAYISSNKVLYYLNHTPRTSYNGTLKAQVNNPILVGPFPQSNFSNGQFHYLASVYVEDRLLVNTEIEGGNLYTLFPNYQKIKQWNKSAIKTTLSSFSPSIHFDEQPLTKEDIDKQVENKITSIMRSAVGFVDDKEYSTNFNRDGYQLNLILDKDSLGQQIEPTLIFIEPKKEKDRGSYQLYYGRTRDFKSLPTEELSIHLIFNDTTSYSYPIKLYKGGKNYLKLDSIHYNTKSKEAQIAYYLFNKRIEKRLIDNPYITVQQETDTISRSVLFDEPKLVTANQNRKIVSGTVKDRYDNIIGATVQVKGTKRGTITDYEGRFELNVDRNATLEILYIGYKPQQVKVTSGYNYNITLVEDEQRLEEVVVVGYSSQKKMNLTGSVSMIDSHSINYDHQVLQGKVAGLMIRGTSTINQNAKPLLIVNGLPYDGNLDDFDTSTILSLNVLKDVSTTAIYGSRGANGVIMIDTNALASKKKKETVEDTKEAAGNSMRRNFHDDAFWQPKLKTDAKGEVNFEVTYPDDITNWNAYFIALGDKTQSDTKKISIRSFKALSARLSTPRFAIRGDSINAVGRIANHYGDSLQLARTIHSNNIKETDQIKIDKSHVDYIPVSANKGDSLTLAYSLQMKNGYFDGEERSFPIFEQGMLQTYGDFKVINDTLTHILNTDPSLGTITFHAETSSLELFLREIDFIDNYPYRCNEQMASKIGALLAKKSILTIQNKTFKEDKKISSLIRDLNKNKNQEGLWGWWNKSESVAWISKHIINVLIDASEAGYKTELDTITLANTLEAELNSSISQLTFAVDKKLPFAKGELLDRIILMQRLNVPTDCNAYLNKINAKLKSENQKDKLKEMFILSFIDEGRSVNVDSLMHYSSKSILGSMYWTEEKKENIQPRYFYRPYETNTENTLMAYQILQNIGGHEQDLEKIRNYFFEQRKDNTWGNIYEISRIIRTIMPDMIKDKNDYTNTIMYINEQKVDKFPYTEKIDATKKVEVKKTGTLPLFATTYQKEWNKTPIREKAKGFEISTIFKMNNENIAELKEGKPTILQTTLTLTGDAEYVQIEIPIPAGCSYESKTIGNYWKEAHREYYKDKVVIFCNKLSKGEHIFDIELIPRYTGKYTLNPAKAELMYFPTHYVNEETNTTVIK